MADEILVAEAAKILGVSPCFVRYLNNTGQLPCRRVSRWRVFDRAQVEAFAKQRYLLQTGQIDRWHTGLKA
jgi:DNA-binding transcriptional MerR regulator